MDDLQRITDQLAASLKRAVFVEDGSFRPLAASAQIGRVDEARVRALLDRSPTEEHFRYFVSSGVAAARTPLRIPASDEHGLLARVMVPIVAAGHVVARLWLIDADPPVTEGDIDLAVEAGREMRPHLLGRSAETRDRAAAGSEILRSLQRAGMNRRQKLFRQLSDDFAITDLERTRVGVLTVLAPPSEGGGEGADVPGVMTGVLEGFLELLEGHRAVAYARGGQLIALLTSSGSTEGTLEQIASAAHRAAALQETTVQSVGIGSALGSSQGFDASLNQAEYAGRIAEAVPELDGRARWDDLGEYRLFYAVEWSEAGVASLHAGVAALLAERRMPLAATLLAYLDREGDVNATSDALSVHRTTLYYRIERATEVLGQEPRGRARFAIHAALRLADLAGLLTPNLSGSRPA